MLEEKTKPIVEFNNLDVVVNTKTLEELNTLMKIYELAGYKWSLGNSAIDNLSERRWARYKDELCINAEKGNLRYGSVDTYKKISSFQEFCETNDLTKEKLNEINEYFR